MSNLCEWCQSSQIKHHFTTVYWELPDGTGAIEIVATPTITCCACEMIYQEEEIVKEIEDQLLLVDTKQLGRSVQYEKLMAMPRLLKRNYFDFLP